MYWSLKKFINFNTVDKLHSNFCFPNLSININQSYNTFSFMSVISCSYCLTFSSRVIALASDSCFAVRAVSNLLLTSLMLPSKSSYLDFSVKLPVGRTFSVLLNFFYMKINNLHAYMCHKITMGTKRNLIWNLLKRGSTSISKRFVWRKSGSAPFLCRTICVTHSSINL